MWQDRVLNPGPLALVSDALPTVLQGLTHTIENLRIHMMQIQTR